MSTSKLVRGWEVVIGFETHTQLATKSKIFSRAATAFGAGSSVHDEAPDNRCYVWGIGDQAGVDKALKSAAHVTTLQFRNNPEVQKRLDAYKAANGNDVAYYTRVVKEAPERARDMLLYKDMQRHEADMRLVEKQLPQAKAFYDAQTPAVQQRIDARKAKDFAAADQIRKALAAEGVEIMDGPSGSTWRRI